MFNEKRYTNIILALFIINIFIFFGFQPDVTSNTNESFEQDTIKANRLIAEADKLTGEPIYEAKFKLAIEKIEAAKSIYKKYKLWELVVKHTNTQASLGDLISVDIKKKYATESLALAKKNLNKNHAELGIAYQQVAEVYLMEEEYNQSIVQYEKCLKIFEHNEEWLSYTWALISKNVNYLYTEQYDLAEKGFLKAQDVYKKYDLEEEVNVTVLELLAVIYSENGNFKAAIVNTLNTIEFYLNKENLSHEDSLFLGSNYSNLGQFHIEQEDFSTALDYLNKSLSYNKVNKKKYAWVLSHISSLYYTMEKYNLSIQFAHQHINTANQLPQKEKVNNLQEIYTTLGNDYLSRKMMDSSLYYYKKALSFPTKKHYTTAVIYYTRFLVEQNKPNEAIDYLKTINPSNLKKYLKSLYYRNYGLAFGLKQDFEQSTVYFQKALHANLPTFTDTTDNYKNPTNLKGLFNKSFFLNDLKFKAQNLSRFPEQKNLEVALATYEVAFQLMDSLANLGNKAINNKRNREFYEEAIAISNELHQLTSDKKYIKKAFYFAERMKSNILISALQNSDKQGVIPKRIQKKEEKLAVNIAFYERQLRMIKTDEAVEKIQLYKDNLTEYRLELSRLKDTIKTDFNKYYNLTYNIQLSTISTIQKALENNQGFISYYSGDSSIYVFTISKDAVQFSKLDSTSIINDKVIAFRQTLDQPNSTVGGFAEYNETATDLYTTILKQSIEQLPKSVNQLTIIPDGVLNNIPFEILTNKVVQANQDFSKLPYLLYDYQIHYAYSATLLRENERQQNQLKTNDECLAYAPPYESDNQPIAKRRGAMQTLRDGTMQLQGTGKEIQAIATYFKGNFDQSETATKANFVEQAPNFGILHLAMHGEANFENENLANLKFVNAKTQDKEQYLLYQNEIVNMDLNAQLVVLSACETGLGKYIYGEGIVSLGRSFMYAGVPSIVMSLWKVDDKATSRLMPYFYENLANDMNKDEALHQAKLTFLKKEDLSTVHPHYWAGFVSIGDVQPIKKGWNWGVWLILGSILLAFGGGFLIWRKFRNIKK